MSPWQRDKAKETASAYLQGRMLPLEAALELRGHLDSDLPGDLQEAWRAIAAVVSETDTITLVKGGNYGIQMSRRGKTASMMKPGAVCANS